MAIDTLLAGPSQARRFWVLSRFQHLAIGLSRNPSAKILGVPQSFFSYSMARTRLATCCAKLSSSFSNHPHLRASEATSAVGGSGGNPFLSVGGDLTRGTHAAHGIWPCDRALSRRPRNHRGDAQPRWSIVDRSAI